jgi:hypothetical protein
MSRLNALLDAPDPQVAVQALAPVAFHRLICEVGLNDALPLLELASAEQVRSAIDLQIWSKDRIDRDSLADWLLAVLALPESPRQTQLKALDVELLGYLLRKQVTVYLAQEDDLPPEPQGTYCSTPDGWFVLDILEDDEVEGPQLAAIIEAFYREDSEATRRLLQNLMWELPTQLEEAAYRWRTGRLEDLGFVNPSEALELYAYLDPESVKLDEQTRDRPLVTDPEPIPAESLETFITPDEASFLARAIARIGDQLERERLAQALVQLANRALAADQISPAETSAAEESLSRLKNQLSLGLEHLSGGDLALAELFLRQVALLRIARVGISLTLRLARKILPAVRAGRLGSTPREVDRLDSPLRQQVQLLLNRRPRFYVAEKEQARPFASLADLDQARIWIASAILAQQLQTKSSYGREPPAGTTFADCFRSELVALLTEQSGPLDRPALQRFVRSFCLEGRLRPQVFRQGYSLAAARLGQVDDEALLQSLIHGWVVVLEEQVARLDPESLDPRFIAGLVLPASGAAG